MIIKKKKNIKEQLLRYDSEQAGVALVMSLLILFLMMTSAVALSRIIIGEVKMTVNTTNSLSAFYAADSAIEKGLYYIKYARNNRGLLAFPSTDPFSALAFNNFTFVDMPYSFYYRKASTTSPGFIVYNIGTSTPAHIDIMDPSGDLPAVIDWDPSAYNTHSYFISWNIKNCFPYHASDKLEITKYSFGASGLLDASVEKDIAICNCSYLSNNACSTNLTTGTITDDRYYRFSFRALDSRIESLSFDIYAYDNSYDPNNPSTYDIIGAFSNSSLIADGSYKNARYRLEVNIPTFGAVSDVFSYVIFSEEALKKDL